MTAFTPRSVIGQRLLLVWLSGIRAAGALGHLIRPYDQRHGRQGHGDQDKGRHQQRPGKDQRRGHQNDRQECCPEHKTWHW